jgi:hypothetical protein
MIIEIIKVKSLNPEGVILNANNQAIILCDFPGLTTTFKILL